MYASDSVNMNSESTDYGYIKGCKYKCISYGEDKGKIVVTVVRSGQL